MGKAMESMSQTMRSMQMTGDTDHDFAMMLRAHHQGAVDMAQVELANGKDPTIRSMAKKVVADQKKEIADIDKWLAKQGKQGHGK